MWLRHEATAVHQWGSSETPTALFDPISSSSLAREPIKGAIQRTIETDITRIQQTADFGRLGRLHFTSRGGHTVRELSNARADLATSQHERQERAEQPSEEIRWNKLLPERAGTTSGHLRSVFDCIQQSTFTCADSYTILFSSFSYASSLPSISHPVWMHKGNR